MIKWSRTIQLYNVALFVREIPCDIGMKKPSPSSLKIYICRKAIYEVETNAGNNLLKFSEEMKQNRIEEIHQFVFYEVFFRK